MDIFNDLVADMAHFLGGCLLVLGPVALGWNHPWYFSFGVIAAATIKEGIIDPIFETPEENGGVIGGITDWLGYIVGVGVALGALKLRHLL